MGKRFFCLREHNALFCSGLCWFWNPGGDAFGMIAVQMGQTTPLDVARTFWNSHGNGGTNQTYCRAYHASRVRGVFAAILRVCSSTACG
jgi:hypothetical protein